MFTLRFLVSLLTLILFVPVFAQAPDVIYNLPQWGQSIVFFALSLTLLVEAIKGRIKKVAPGLPSFVIQLGTVALGIGISFFMYTQNLLLDPFFATLAPPLNWLLYGVIAGVAAVGGYDLIMAIVKALGGVNLGGKVITVPGALPTPKEAEKQVDAVPGIIASTLRTFALSQGIPAFIVDAVLALNPIEHASALIHDMIARKRSLTPEEVAVDQLAWAKANPVTEEELEAAKERLRRRQGA